MGSTAIIALIDNELAKLREKRSTLVKREKSSKAATAGRSGAARKAARRRLSPAARAKIAEAQRKRWAAVKMGKMG